MAVAGTHDITHELRALSEGEAGALDRLIPLVYAELRRIAHDQLRGERGGHTLSTTALVHEAYLRLVNVEQANWHDRAHFFAVAAGLMRRILVDYARARLREKREGRLVRVPLAEALPSPTPQPLDLEQLIDLDDALTRLEAKHPRQCRVVECRCVTGLSVEETAAALHLSPATVKRDWAGARAWLSRELADTPVPLERLSGQLTQLADTSESLSSLRLAERLRAGLADRYHVGRILGRGGMGIVLAATDVEDGSRFALKVLEPDIARGIAAPRFLREIAIATHLAHPNILPVHDSGAVDGLPWYVMPLIDGPSLRERLRREPRLPLAEALGIAWEVALALAYAHERGVVHRDIKPGNILLDGRHAVVADFGIARAARTAAEDGEGRDLVLGTPEYMSPEQREGGTVDGRSDIFSLGCVLREMVGEKAPEPVRLAIRRALAPAARDRYSTADAFAEDIERCIAGLAPASG